MEVVKGALEAKDEEVLRTGSNEYAIPCVDNEGNDQFMVITFKIAVGSKDRDTGELEPYDGYAEATNYEFHVKEAEKKARVAAEKKKAKMEADRKAREAKARAKADHLAQKEG